MRTIKKQNEHDNTLPDTAVSLKMGDFNTPPVNPIFQKENGGLKLIFQNHRCFFHARSSLNGGFVCWEKRKSR